MVTLLLTLLHNGKTMVTHGDICGLHCKTMIDSLDTVYMYMYIIASQCKRCIHFPSVSGLGILPVPISCGQDMYSVYCLFVHVQVHVHVCTLYITYL